MSLSVGIVGLPNVGKSTLFNALVKKQQAYVANFPFATIEPNIGVVPVLDSRLDVLSSLVKESDGLSFFPPKVYATCEFVDIAGLIAGAHKGEGLGNKFLSHIREVDAICHVVRDFSDPDIVKEGSISPKSDFETVETELLLADFETVEKAMNAKRKEVNPKYESMLKKVYDGLSKSVAVRNISLDEHERVEVKSLCLLTLKPILVVINVSEEDLKNANVKEELFSKELGLKKDQVIAVCAKTEMQLADLSNEEQKEYLQGIGINESGLERIIKKAFSTLGLITFLTAGEKEVRAWTIKKGSTALEASGEIHTDFVKKFIKADVVSFDDFVSCKGWKGSRELGKARSEGKDYIVLDGDVVEFKIGS